MKPEQLLSLLGSAVDTIAPEMPAGPASIVAQGVAAALHLVSGLVASGRDPVAEIARIKAADADLRDVEDGWAAKIAQRFPDVPT